MARLGERSCAGFQANRSWLLAVGWVLSGVVVAIELVFLFRGSALVELNSDTVQKTLEASDILRGNIFLHGWTLGDQNFYLTDDFFFLITRVLFGRTLLAIYSVPVAIYALLLLVAAGIVWSVTRDRWARVLGIAALWFYLGTPTVAGMGRVVYVGATHVATFGFCLLGWLALDAIQRAPSLRAARRHIALLVASALIAMFSDPFSTVMYLVPTIVGLALAMLAPHRRWFQASLIAILLGSFCAARFGMIVMQWIGGFATKPDQSLDFVAAADLGRNATGLLFGLFTISGGYVFGHSLLNPGTIAEIFHIFGLVLMLSVMLMTLRRAFRGDGWSLRTVLAVAMALQLVACLASREFSRALDTPPLTGGAATRYLLPVFLFGGILVALELPGMLRRIPLLPQRWLASGIGAVALVAAFGLFVGEGIHRWREAPWTERAPARVAAKWLLDRGLTQGQGEYWAGMIVTALSDEKVTVAAMIASGDKLVPFEWCANHAWYQAKPQFVIYRPSNRFGVSAVTVEQTYGPPEAISHVAGYDIAVLRKPGG